jgi:hypothetical protein
MPPVPEDMGKTTLPLTALQAAVCCQGCWPSNGPKATPAIESSDETHGSRCRSATLTEPRCPWIDGIDDAMTA